MLFEDVEAVDGFGLGGELFGLAKAKSGADHAAGEDDEDDTAGEEGGDGAFLDFLGDVVPAVVGSDVVGPLLGGGVVCVGGFGDEGPEDPAGHDGVDGGEGDEEADGAAGAEVADGGAVDEEQHEEGADHREVGGEDGGE